MPHANAYVNGGYEVETSQVNQFETFKFVGKTIDEFSKWKKADAKRMLKVRRVTK